MELDLATAFVDGRRINDRQLRSVCTAKFPVRRHDQPHGRIVCVLPRTSAINVTLLAFAAERRAADSSGRPAPPLSIDISRPPGPQQQTRRSGVRRTNDETSRQTDRRTDALQFHRPCSAYYASSVNTVCHIPR